MQIKDRELNCRENVQFKIIKKKKKNEKKKSSKSCEVRNSFIRKIIQIEMLRGA